MREYIATVKEVNALDMIVEYAAPGFDPVLVGVLRPLLAEDIAEVIRSHAPETQWAWVERTRAEKQAVREGFRFIAKLPDPEPEPEPAPVLADLEIKRATV